MQSGERGEGVAEGDEAGVWVQSGPGAIPDGSIVTGEIAVVGPGDLYVALEAGC